MEQLRTHPIAHTHTQTDDYPRFYASGHFSIRHALHASLRYGDRSQRIKVKTNDKFQGDDDDDDLFPQASERDRRTEKQRKLLKHLFLSVGEIICVFHIKLKIKFFSKIIRVDIRKILGIFLFS